MDRMGSVRVSVTFVWKGRIFVGVELINDEPKVGDIVAQEHTGFEFQVTGFGMISAEAHSSGKRAYVLKPVGEDAEIFEGDILVW